MSEATETICRTRIVLAGQGQSAIYATDSYQDVLDRVNAAREATMKISKSAMGNPLSIPLVHVRMIVTLDEDGETGVVDACFNPMHVMMIYRSAPNV